jgi:hypothetical protein
VCGKITRGKRAVVAFGAAQVGTVRTKRQCGPCELVKRRLSSHHRATVIMVDEFRTSQACSTCQVQVGKFAVLKRQRVIEDGIPTVTKGGRLHHQDNSEGGATSYKTCHNVRACANPFCRIVWNGDVNATRNIAWICMSIARGEGRPAEFMRAGVRG